MKLRNALLTIISLGLTVGSFSTDICAQDALPDLRIKMTGYLLGYYRVPDVQPRDFLEDCLLPRNASYWANASPTAMALHRAGDPWADASPAALDLHKGGTIPFTPEPNTILVGMGDNFGVELYSRTYGAGDAPTIAEDLHPKLRQPGTAWQPTDNGKIGDNVGCFLSMAGYTAVVPDKEDFYFGPERLRRIAQRLDSDRVPHRVPMLAANLIQQTSYWREPAKIPDSQKELNFTPGLPEGVQAVEVSEGGKVLPFLRKITLCVKAGVGADLKPYVCSASPSNDSDNLNPFWEKARRCQGLLTVQGSPEVVLAWKR